MNSVRVVVREEVKSEIVSVRKDIDTLKKHVKKLRKDLGLNEVNFAY